MARGEFNELADILGVADRISFEIKIIVPFLFHSGYRLLFVRVPVLSIIQSDSAARSSVILSSHSAVPPPFPSDSQERAPSSMRVSHDPRGRYCDEDEDEAATEEDSGRRSRSPDSPRVPVVIGPWLKMAVDFADRKDANGDLDDFVGVGLFNLHANERRTCINHNFRFLSFTQYSL